PPVNTRAGAADEKGQEEADADVVSPTDFGGVADAVRVKGWPLGVTEPHVSLPRNQDLHEEGKHDRDRCRLRRSELTQRMILHFRGVNHRATILATGEGRRLISSGLQESSLKAGLQHRGGRMPTRSLTYPSD